MALLPRYRRFDIMSGQGAQERKVATLKAMVVLLPEVPEEDLDGELTEKYQLVTDTLTTRNKYVVRLYILRALNMLGTDDAGDVDAYLVVHQGGHELLNTRKTALENCFNVASFFEFVEVTVELPGDALITVSVHDKDPLPVLDDLVGSTTIDLEDRIYSPYYTHAELGAGGQRPPLEWRSLYKPEYVIAV